MKSTEKQLDRAEELYKAAFNVPREPRSDAYRRGVMAALIFRCAGVRIKENCPYKSGTVEMDAFLAGTDEGHSIWRNSGETPRNQAVRPTNERSDIMTSKEILEATIKLFESSPGVLKEERPPCPSPEACHPLCQICGVFSRVTGDVR